MLVVVCLIGLEFCVSYPGPLDNNCALCNTPFVIKTIKHKGLKPLYERGDLSKLPADRVHKIILMMTALDAAETLEPINRPAWRLHTLKGDLEGLYAIDVSGNYRLIFRFEGGNVFDLDFVDYH